MPDNHDPATIIQGNQKQLRRILVVAVLFSILAGDQLISFGRSLQSGADVLWNSVGLLLCLVTAIVGWVEYIYLRKKTRNMSMLPKDPKTIE